MQPARLVHGVTVGVKSLKNTKAPGYVSLPAATTLERLELTRRQLRLIVDPLLDVSRLLEDGAHKTLAKRRRRERE